MYVQETQGRSKLPLGKTQEAVFRRTSTIKNEIITLEVFVCSELTVLCAGEGTSCFRQDLEHLSDLSTPEGTQEGLEQNHPAQSPLFSEMLRKINKRIKPYSRFYPAVKSITSPSKANL